MTKVNLVSSVLRWSSVSPGGSFWKNSAVTIGKVVLAILAFSVVSAGAGKAMQLGGIKLISTTRISPSLTNQVANNMGLGLQQVGKGLSLAGKYAFLSVAVPIYAAVYELPKWIFNEGLPKVARLTHQYVVIPICNGIIQATKFVSERFIKTAQTIYNQILAPLGSLIGKATVWTWKAIILPVTDKILQATIVLKDAIVHVAQEIYNHILIPLGSLVKKAVVWMWKTVLIPVINKVVQATMALKDAIVHVAQAIYNHVLAPLGSLVKKAVMWTWKAVIVPVINKVLQATIALKGAIVHVAQAIYNHILAPLGSLVEKAAVWTWKAVIIPVFNGVAQGYGVIKDLVIPVAQRIYNYTLKPLGQSIGYSFEVTIEYTSHVFTAVIGAGNAVINSAYETYLWLMGRG